MIRKFIISKRIFILLIIYLFTLPTQTIHADIIDATRHELKGNVEEVKQSIKSLQNTLNDLKSDLTNPQEGLKNVLSKYEELIGGFDIENLKKTDSESLKSKIEAIKTELKEGSILEGVGDEYKQKIENLNNDIERVIRSVKNIISINYTTPVGLRGGYGQTGLEISIDTLKYTREENGDGTVQMTVHADFQLPFSIAEDGANTKIGFIGENIHLVGDGSSKIMLDTKNTTGNFSIAKEIVYFPILDGKAQIGIKKDSYIEIDCNGFKGILLDGEFVFSSDVIYPANKNVSIGDKSTIPTKIDPNGATSDNSVNGDDNNTDEVTASESSNEENSSEAQPNKKSQTPNADSVMIAEFRLETSDLENIVIETGFKKPFKVKCTGDITYEVQGLVADFSTVSNAENFQFPKGYKMPFKNDDATYWTGFALKTLEVNVGDEIPFIDTLRAYNMLIDETGVSGWFGASFGDGKGELKTGVIDTKINSVEVAIANGKVVGGGIAGNLDVIALKDKEGKSLNLNIDGSIYSDSNDNLCYSIGVENLSAHTYRLPLLETSDVTLGAGTSITYEKQLTPDSTYKKGFFFNLNGSIDLACSFLKVEGLGFQDLKLSTCEPNFGGGKFALNSAKSLNLGALEIELLNVSAGFDTTNSKRTASFGAEVNVKLIGDGKGVSCGGKFSCSTDVDNGWKPNKLHVDAINVDADFSAFHLKGGVERYDVEGEITISEEHKFGRGFSGELQISMDALNIDVGASAMFGKTKYMLSSNNESAYRYWYVYANVGVPPGTIIFPPAVMLNSVSLALYSRMQYSVNQTTKEVTRDYFPSPKIGFGFQGGIKVYAAQESLVGAEVKLGMDFSSGGGVKNINLEGGIYMLGDNQDNSIVNGTVYSYYDFEKEILKLNADVEAKLACIQGHAKIELYSDPKIWYFNMGSLTDPTQELKFAKIAKAKAYFMMGHNIPASLPPLDSRITELFNVTQSSASGHQEDFVTGKGFAFGAAVSVECGFDKFIYAGVNMLGGVDVMVAKRPGQNCENSAYRGYGRAYVWLDLGAGVKPRKKKFEFLEMSAAAEVNAEFPKPLYLYGQVGFRYSVLGGLFSGNANAKFEAGSTCNWENIEPFNESNDGTYDFSQHRNSLETNMTDGENFEQIYNQAMENVDPKLLEEDEGEGE